ncbi:hypothetical protein BH18ACT10_BH18ACT10_14040 [soil metagenome]
MFRYRISLVLLVHGLVLLPSAVAQVRLEFLDPPLGSTQDQRLRLSGTFGFSVVQAFGTDTYRLFATTYASRLRWNSGALEDAFHPRTRPECFWDEDPQNWHSGCVDNIGLFSKSATSGDDRWTAHPSGLIDTFPSPSEFPAWPNSLQEGENFGIHPGYVSLITKDAINAVLPFPPATGNGCHPVNLRDLYEHATAGANGKAFEVHYQNAQSRWYMPFNAQIHSEFNQGDNSDDNWRIMWAYSDFGAVGAEPELNWHVHPQILFRSIRESWACGLGFLLTDFFLDNNYFYLVFTEVDTQSVYLARSQTAGWAGEPGGASTIPGYTAWEVAQAPVGGVYQWRTITAQEHQQQLDFGPAGINAYNILPSPSPYRNNLAFVAQASVARVYNMSGTTFRYLAVLADCDPSVTQHPCPPDKRILRLFSTAALNQPFRLEGGINTTGIALGGNGWELGFTKYVDDGLPHRLASGFDLWLVQAIGDGISNASVTRRRAVVTGGEIYEPYALRTLPPCRVLDTREASGPTGGAPLAAGEAREFAVGGLCGVPATAKAVFANVTAVGPTHTGELRSYPADIVTPPLFTSVAYDAGKTRAAASHIGLGPMGSLGILVSQAAGTSHVLLDIQGYFE